MDKRNLMIRALSGTVYVGIILYALIAPVLISVGIFYIIAALCLWEFKKVQEIIQNEKISFISFFSGLFVLFLVSVLNTFHEISFSAAMALILGVYFLLQGTGLLINFTSIQKHPMLHITSVLYIGLPFWFLLDWKQEISRQAGDPLSLVFIFVIIWISDTMAYLGGSLYGRKPLQAEISPKKTMEGTVTGIICSMIAGYFLVPRIYSVSGFAGTGIALLLSVFSVWGDLYQSLLKRKAGIKDSGNLLPGHGGAWDRLDSFLFVMPPAYLIHQLLKMIQG
jgi:phosphatidate cytidylyltransferase